MFQNNDDVCKKIDDLFPDIECGKDISVGFDSINNAFVVELKHNNRSLKTFVEREDVNSCFDKGECFGLGLDIALLKDSVR